MNDMDESGSTQQSAGDESMREESLQEESMSGEGRGQAKAKGQKQKAGRKGHAKSPKGGEKGGRKAHANFEGYSHYINKTLKSIAEGQMGAKKGAMLSMSALVHDMLDRLGTEAGTLCKCRSASTISVGDIEAAVRLLFPGELSIHAVQAIHEAHAKMENQGN